MSALDVRDRGQSLFLAPIGFLVVLILGMATLEVGAIHLRQRQLADMADSLANDGATVGFDVDTFRENGSLNIIPSQAALAASPDVMSNSNIPTANVAGFQVTGGAEPQVTVTLTYDHQYIMARGIFGGSQTLTATGTATLVPSN